MSYNRYMLIGAFASVLAVSPALAQTEQAEEAQEQEIEMSQVPQAAMDAAKQEFGDVEITEAYVVEKEGQQVYELEGESAAGEEVAVHVTAEGQVLKEEEESQ